MNKSKVNSLSGGKFLEENLPGGKNLRERLGQDLLSSNCNFSKLLHELIESV
jgi:hypothetical protein